MIVPIFGRDNLALTVMVPWDCENNCEFCPSKKLYQEKKGCLEAVKEKMRYVFNRLNAPIRDVVFTGGEPTENTYTCGGADLSRRCGGYGGTSVCGGGSKRTCGGGC